MHSFFTRLARLMAVLGGIVLCLLILLTCVSIFGRSMNGILHSDAVQSAAPGLAAWLLGLGIGPVNGDFEVVEAAMAFCIFAFLPLCQINGAHASVDIFTAKLPRRVQHGLRWVVDVIFAAVLILIAWQLCQGMLSKLRSGQVTFLLQFPIWWAYAAALSGAVITAIIGVYLAAIRTVETVTGRDILPADLEADH